MQLKEDFFGKGVSETTRDTLEREASEGGLSLLANSSQLGKEISGGNLSLLANTSMFDKEKSDGIG